MTGLQKLLMWKAASGVSGTRYFTNFEIGTIDGTTGKDVDNATRARTVGYISVSSFKSCNVASGYQYFAFLYKSDESFSVRIPSAWTNDPLLQTDITNTYTDAEYVRILMRRSNGGNITDDDLDIMKTFIQLN